MSRIVVVAGVFPTYHTHVSGVREVFLVDALSRVQR